MSSGGPDHATLLWYLLSAEESEGQQKPDEIHLKMLFLRDASRKVF